MMKLHLGCGSNALAGWVNIDLDSPVADMCLDLRDSLPFENGSVSHIYLEHLIEHIEYDEAISLLKECKRVLISEGVIRLSTPDLLWITLNYQSSVKDEWGDLWQPDTPCKLMNEGMRSWGHKFVYDRSELVNTLKIAGFKSIIHCQWGDSWDSALAGIESRPFHKEIIIEARCLVANGDDVLEYTSDLRSWMLNGTDNLLVKQGYLLDKLQRLVSQQAALITGLESTLEDRTRHIVSLEQTAVNLASHIKNVEDELSSRGKHICILEQTIGNLEQTIENKINHIKNVETKLASIRSSWCGKMYRIIQKL